MINKNIIKIRKKLDKLDDRLLDIIKQRLISQSSLVKQEI